MHYIEGPNGLKMPILEGRVEEIDTIMETINLTKKELKQRAKMGWIFTSGLETCTKCDGVGKIWHTRSCAEDDPSGWSSCEECDGDGMIIVWYQVRLAKEA